MTPSDILASARDNGLTLTLEPPDTIVMRGTADARARHLATIRQHKQELVAFLSGHTARSETSRPEHRHNGHIVTAPPPLPATDHEDIEAAIVERAAIQEYDGGMPRPEAERAARSAMRVFRCLVAMPAGDPRPARWVTLLLPGVETLDGAREAAVWRFGAERVLEIREQEITR